MYNAQRGETGHFDRGSVWCGRADSSRAHGSRAACKATRSAARRNGGLRRTRLPLAPPPTRRATRRAWTGEVTRSCDLVPGPARLFLLRRAGFVTGSRRVRNGPWGHVRLGRKRPAGASGFYLLGEGRRAIRWYGAFPFGSDLLDSRIRGISLLAFVSRSLRHSVLVWDTGIFAQWIPQSCIHRHRLSRNPRKGSTRDGPVSP